MKVLITGTDCYWCHNWFLLKMYTNIRTFISFNLVWKFFLKKRTTTHIQQHIFPPFRKDIALKTASKSNSYMLCNDTSNGLANLGPLLYIVIIIILQMVLFRESLLCFGLKRAEKLLWSIYLFFFYGYPTCPLHLKHVHQHLVKDIFFHFGL